jgi:heptosyltransferase-1
VNTVTSTPQPFRLLLIKTSSMGDLVHTLSALEEARQHRPSLAVDWVAEEAFADLPVLSAAVARVIPVAMRRWRHALFASATRREIKAFVHDLRRTSYDAVIDAQGLVKSAWITGLSRCPAGKWGWDRASIREPLAGMVLQHRVHAPDHLHAIKRLRILFSASLGYAPASGPPALLPSASARHRPQLLQQAIGDQGFVIFLHGTSRQAKAWPIAQWVSLARAVTAAGLRVVLPWGSGREQEAAQAIAHAAGELAWVPPRMTIAEIAACIMTADAAVGVDSGLMHLAAALGVPTVAVMPAGLEPRYAASRFAPPWQDHVRVVVPPSAQAGIDAGAVERALMALIKTL